MTIRIAALLLAALCSTALCAERGAHRPHRRLRQRPLPTAQGRPPFFWLGDTAWLLFQKLDRAETERYLEDRRRKGFNVVQVMVLHDPADRNAYGSPALLDADPARPNVTPGRSLSRPGEYDYWDHVDWVVRLAARKGIYVAMVPAWGSIVKSGGLNAGNAAVYARFLAGRYKGASNIIWVNGGDVRGDDHPQVWKALGADAEAG